MGVHGGLFFDPEENHYILVNRRNEIIEFLKQEMNLTCVREQKSLCFLNYMFEDYEEVIDYIGNTGSACHRCSFRSTYL